MIENFVAGIIWFSIGAFLWWAWPKVRRWVEKPRPPIWERWGKRK